MTRKVWLNILGCIVAGIIGCLIFIPDYGFSDMYRILIFIAVFMVYFYCNKYIRERRKDK